jgi:hypothetical protein
MVAISTKSTTLNESKEVELVFVRLNLCNILPLKKRLASNSGFFIGILTKFRFNKYEFNLYTTFFMEKWPKIVKFQEEKFPNH